MAERLRTTQEQRDRWATFGGGWPSWLCADIDTLLARVRELKAEREGAAVARHREGADADRAAEGGN